MTRTCPTCGDHYKELGTHFRHRVAHRPDLSDRQRAIVEYLVLRGVTVRRDGAEPRLELFSTDAPWLREVAGALGWLANDPRRHDARDEDADVWSFTTVPHPELDYGGPTDVERLRPLTARLLVGERGELVGALFGSLHVDVRGWDVEGGPRPPPAPRLGRHDGRIRG